jgi:hypothetical protein
LPGESTMFEVLPYLFLLVVATYIPVWIWGLIAIARLSRYLDKHHLAIYESLGRPSAFWMGGDANRRLRRFMLKREFQALGDPRLDALGRQARLGWILGIAMFSVMLGVMVLSWIVR